MQEALCNKILVVEDEPTLRLALQDALQAEGCLVHTAEDGNTGLELFRTHSHDIVLTDMVMPGLSGLEVIEKILEIRPDVSVFAFTAYGSVDTAVQAMKLGAVDFITKPFRISELVDRIRRVAERRLSGKEENEGGNSLDERYRFGQLLGHSASMLEIYELIESVAGSDANILISGDSGTGKELAAAAVHFNSHRREHPFIKVSCASLSETLLESELFGHEKGAFTGALHRKTGRFEQAHRGTLFLDEIGDISETVQVKLLRVLQEREFERVGGNDTIHVDVRIVCASLHDLQQRVERGTFREDLYYRINTVQVRMPSLAERQDDIRLLADHFRELHCNRLRKEVSGFREEAYRALEVYSWPGNVRELKNVVERAVLLTRSDRIEVEDLPVSIRPSSGKVIAGPDRKIDDTPASFLLDEVVHSAEEKHLRKVLQYTGFNRTKAAELLGISRKTLWEKMKSYGIYKD